MTTLNQINETYKSKGLDVEIAKLSDGTFTAYVDHFIARTRKEKISEMIMDDLKRELNGKRSTVKMAVYMAEEMWFADHVYYSNK